MTFPGAARRLLRALLVSEPAESTNRAGADPSAAGFELELWPRRRQTSTSSVTSTTLAQRKTEYQLDINERGNEILTTARPTHDIDDTQLEPIASTAPATCETPKTIPSARPFSIRTISRAGSFASSCSSTSSSVSGSASYTLSRKNSWASASSSEEETPVRAAHLQHYHRHKGRTQPSRRTEASEGCWREFWL
ncbi:Uu.00g109830.m01.CDS01 [Anthostomella pinea]|uniref:Uu.00g109830.m01.CDS01 n=1 Tax=Anthostomella pinea TaxID=933095 RepID=A0AAI8VET5_9PEZI|nr:Uu.00g109830.m01.CDS01 [Anthostomella pinea]